MPFPALPACGNSSGVQEHGCRLLLVLCGERGQGRGREARHNGCVTAVRKAYEYFSNNGGTEEQLQLAREAQERVEKQCVIM